MLFCQQCNNALSLTLAALISKCFRRPWFMLNNSYYSYFFVEKNPTFSYFCIEKAPSFFLLFGEWLLEGLVTPHCSHTWRYTQLRHPTLFSYWKTNTGTSRHIVLILGDIRRYVTPHCSHTGRHTQVRHTTLFSYWKTYTGTSRHIVLILGDICRYVTPHCSHTLSLFLCHIALYKCNACVKMYVVTLRSNTTQKRSNYCNISFSDWLRLCVNQVVFFYALRWNKLIFHCSSIFFTIVKNITVMALSSWLWRGLAYFNKHKKNIFKAGHKQRHGIFDYRATTFLAVLA